MLISFILLILFDLFCSAAKTEASAAVALQRAAEARTHLLEEELISAKRAHQATEGMHVCVCVCVCVCVRAVRTCVCLFGSRHSALLRGSHRCSKRSLSLRSVHIRPQTFAGVYVLCLRA